MSGVRRAIGKAVDFPVEHEDIAVDEMAAQMVIGSAMAKAQLEDDALLAPDLAKGPVEASVLGFQPEEQALQPRGFRHIPTLKSLT